jgi:hypothetical protein
VHTIDIFVCPVWGWVLRRKRESARAHGGDIGIKGWGKVGEKKKKRKDH